MTHAMTMYPAAPKVRYRVQPGRGGRRMLVGTSRDDYGLLYCCEEFVKPWQAMPRAARRDMMRRVQAAILAFACRRVALRRSLS